MRFEAFGFDTLFCGALTKIAAINYEFFNQIGVALFQTKVDVMKNPACPHCEKAIQHRHTFMTTLPLTLVCAGCGSWLKLDVKRSNNAPVMALGLITLFLAYFSPYFLILLPLYLVLSMGPLQNFSVELIKKRKAELWTINRRTGHLRPVNEAEEAADRDLQLSKKLVGARSFRSLSGADRKKGPSPQGGARAALAASLKRGEFGTDEMPSGLPH